MAQRDFRGRRAGFPTCPGVVGKETRPTRPILSEVPKSPKFPNGQEVEDLIMSASKQDVSDESMTSGPGTESVWDYPRPPRLEDSSAHIQVIVAGEIIADTRRAKRILETSHPPVYYISPEDVRMELLRPAPGKSWCEWKGEAAYYDLFVGDIVVPRAGWTYPNPTADYAAIRAHIAFYPSKMDSCTLDGERVTAQGGDFYGGWITSNIVGPFKGAPGTQGW